MNDIKWYCVRLEDNPDFTLDDSDIIPFQRHGKCGYADYYTKEILISPTWDVALPFRGSQAIVINGASLDDFLPMNSFHSRIPYREDESQVFKAGIINRTGEVILPVVYDNISDFNGHIAVVKQKGGWGLIDYKGNTVISFDYERISLRGILAFAIKNDKWGVITHTGEIIIDCELSERPYMPLYKGYYNGYYFLIRRGRKFGVMHKDGRLITCPTMLKREALFLINKLEGRI